MKKVYKIIIYGKNYILYIITYFIIIFMMEYKIGFSIDNNYLVQDSALIAAMYTDKTIGGYYQALDNKIKLVKGIL